MKILLLEDDEVISENLKEYFGLFDVTVDIYSNGMELLESRSPEHYDIMILDINTPGMSGLDLLKEFRNMGIETPAIFITAMSDIEYLKSAYSYGCDDYIRKPFDLEELEIRIRHIVQKRRGIIELEGGYRFDIRSETLYLQEDEVSLNRNERRLLYCLLKQRGTTVRKEYIKDYIWDSCEVCDNTLRTTVKKLRNKLKSDFIESVRGEGYRIGTK